MTDPSTPRIASVELGRLHWGAFRDALRLLAFHGHPITWHESPGILSRVFHLRGPTASLAAADRVLDTFRKPA